MSVSGKECGLGERDKQTARWTGKQTDRQTEGQAHRPTGRLLVFAPKNRKPRNAHFYL